jgi:Catalytic LigB subunit of aromatic ring-opening dioxygenase
MAEILGLGVTHYPPLIVPDQKMARILESTLKSERVPAALKDPAGWPEPMRKEWRANQDWGAAAEHRRRHVAGFRAVRQALDAFRPDFVLVWGDDQYENFREEGVPPFCVFALDTVECRPHQPRGFFDGSNVWNEPLDMVLTVKGHRQGAVYLASALLDAGFDVTYAYKMRYERGLPHAFVNTVLFLDYDRAGFDYPMVPFHVNCYGASVISKRGAVAHLQGGAASPDPPGPTPARCFALGGAVAWALAASPWRVALIASSSWSHAFLTEKNHWLYPDVVSDRARFDELRDGEMARWAKLTTAQIEDAGQQEFLNWVCLAGAMQALGRRPWIVDYIETYIFNSNKCFAIFPPA